MKLLCFGDTNVGKSSIIQVLLNGQAINPDDQYEHTQSISSHLFNYKYQDSEDQEINIHEVPANADYSKYISNLDGVIFIVDSTVEDFEQQTQLFVKFIQDENIAQLPVLILVNKSDLNPDQDIDIILNQFQLNNIVDRQWMICKCSAVENIGIKEGLDSLIQGILDLQQEEVQYQFEAEPKVVQSKTKYKEPTQQLTQSEQTYQNLMADKNFKLLSPVVQEQEYIKREKDRIKLENMHTQLINFKKNIKKMKPYDIKPSQNPRINVNLQFFLTDNKVLIDPSTTDQDTQTDVFKHSDDEPDQNQTQNGQSTVKSSTKKKDQFIEKKTGIDVATQILDNDLFNFDREVQSIVDVIVTKTLEQSLLEIEQENEIEKMKEYKEQYYKRYQQAKANNQSYIEKEVDRIKNKDKKLDEYIEVEEKKINTLKRVLVYQISKNYLKNVKLNSFESLYKNGYYQNNLQNVLKSDYVNFLIEGTQEELKKTQIITSNLTNLFDQDCINPQLNVKDPKVDLINKKKQKIQQKRFNLENGQKFVRLFYQHNEINVSNFVFKLKKYLEGSLQEYEQKYKEFYDQLQAQVDSTEIQQEQMKQQLDTEYPQIPQGYFGYSVKNIKQIAFTLSLNIFYQQNDDNQLQIELLAIDKTGQIVNKINKQNNRQEKFIKYRQLSRNKNCKFNDDYAIIINQDKIPEDIKAIVCLVKLNNVNNFNLENYQYARFGLQDYQYQININNVKFNKIKLEEIQNQNPEEGETYCTYLVPYILSLKEEAGLYLENFQISTFKTLNTNNQEQFYSDIEQFYQKQEIPHQLEEGQEEPQKQEAYKLYSVAFDCQQLIYNNDNISVEQINEQFIKQIQDEQPALYENFEEKIEIKIKNHEFTSKDQLDKVRKIGEIQIFKIKEPEPEPEPEQQDEEQQEQIEDDQ